MLELEVAGEARQEALGMHLAQQIVPPCILCLEGELGTGKTTLARGILRGFGYQGRVKSPTYTLLEPYELDHLACYHFDLYRLADPEELTFLGIEDLLRGDAVLLVEWPERGRGVLPAPDLVITIRYRGQGRVVQFTSQSEKGIQIINNLQKVWLKD
jgi:tRNA threonylcarbamoyladenosine biosynthesis protein TsaE